MDQILRTEIGHSKKRVQGYPAIAMVEELPSRIARQYRKNFVLETKIKPMFKVTVQGHPPFAFERIYYIETDSDKGAAFQGLSRFADEMAKLEAVRKGA